MTSEVKDTRLCVCSKSIFISERVASNFIVVLIRFILTEKPLSQNFLSFTDEVFYPL